MNRTRPSLSRLASRGLFIGVFAGSLAALAMASGAGAQAIAAFNTNQPVSFNADRIELQDRQNRVAKTRSECGCVTPYYDQSNCNGPHSRPRRCGLIDCNVL